MSLVIKFYFTSSMLNMFRKLIHPSSGACDFSIVSPHWSCVLVSMCVGVLDTTPTQPHRNSNTVEKSQAPDDRCINVRNVLNIGKGKSFPLQAQSGPEGSRKLSFLDFVDRKSVV